MRVRFFIVASLITSLVFGGCASLPDDTHLANQVFLGEKWPVFHNTSVNSYPDLNHFIPWSRPQLIKDAILEMLELTR